MTASVVVGVITATVGATLIAVSARRALEAEVREQSARTAEDAAVRTDDRIRARANKLQLVATREPIANLAPGAESELRVALKTAEEFDRIVLYDLGGRPVAAASSTEELAASEVPALPGTDRTAGTLDATVDQTPSGPALNVAVPVERPPGSPVGTLVGTAPLQTALSPLLLSYDEQTVKMLVASDGRILVHPDRQSVQDRDRIPATALQEPGVAGAKLGSIELDEGSALSAAEPLATLDAQVVVAQPEATAMAPVNRTTRQLVLILLLVILATVATVTLVGTVLLRPIRDLVDAAGRLGRGDHGVRVPVRGSTEVATLATEFNRMAAALERRIDELRQQRRTEEELRREARYIETMYRIGTALTSELDMDTVIQTVTDEGTQLVGAEVGAFFYNEVDPTGEKYMLYTLAGLDRERFENFPMPRNTRIFSPTFTGEGPVRLDDVTADPRYGRNPPYHGMPEGHPEVRSYLAVPVISRDGDVIGGLFFGHAEIGRFTAEHERLATGLAGQASIALDNARLYAAERRSHAEAEAARDRLAVLVEASRVLSTTMNLDLVLENLAELGATRIADVCIIDLLEDDASVRRVAVRYDERHRPWADRLERSQADLSDRDDPVSRVLRTGKAEVVQVTPDTIAPRGRDGGDDRVHDAPSGTGIVVPLPGRSGPLGTFSLVTLESSEAQLAEDDLSLIEEIGRRAGVAIDNAQLYALQRGVAETLQHSLLPEALPHLPGFRTAVRYVPGGPEVDVGGDWYDVFELPGGRVAFAMGDVVGRGTKAASVMGQLRNALRAYALEEHDPCEAVDRLNRLTQYGTSESFATLVYGVYDPATGDLRLCNAGHPPPVVVTPDEEVVFLSEGRNPPLGALPGSAYTDERMALEPGSILLLYTDGLVEERGRSLDEGFAALRASIEAGTIEVNALCDRILERSIRDGEVADDVAILALQPIMLGPRLKMQLSARPQVLAGLRAALRRWLAIHGAEADEIYEILVSVGEACTNAIEHGSTGPRSTFEIEVLYEDGVNVWVRDAGRWREPRPSLRGRGLAIIESFMDEVDVRRSEQGTELVMRRRLREIRGEGS